MIERPIFIHVVAGRLGEGSGSTLMALRTAAALIERGHRLTVATDAETPLLGTGTAVTTLDSAMVAAAHPGGEPEVVHLFELCDQRANAHAAEIAERAGAVLAVTPATVPELWRSTPLAEQLCRRADVAFVLTRIEAERLSRLGVPRSILRMVAQAGDIGPPTHPQRFRLRFGLRGPIVVFLGRRTVDKGIDVFLDSIELVREAIPETNFIVAGPADPGGSFTQLTDRQQNLLDLGLVDPQMKQDMLAASDLLCLPTKQDVFPLVFVEAWAAGSPVISGDFEGADAVVNHGVDGLIVPTTAESIAAGIVGLLTDGPRRRNMADAAVQRYRNEHTWSRVAKEVERGYIRVLGQRRRPGNPGQAARR